MTEDYWKKNGLVKPQQIVVCAANRKDGVIFAGARHCDSVMYSQSNMMQGIKLTNSEQGFINQFGEFLTREEALAAVLENGQPFNKERNGSTTELFSEGLY